MLILNTEAGDRVEMVQAGDYWMPADACHRVADNFGGAFHADFVEHVSRACERGERKGVFTSGQDTCNPRSMAWEITQGIETREIGGRWVCFAGISPETSKAQGWGESEDEARAHYARVQPVPDVQALAEEFGRLLCAELGEQVYEVNELNRTEPTGELVCHSGDFTDPNQIMLNAWENLTGIEPEICGMNDYWQDPTMAAWTIARRAGFYASKFLPEPSQTVLVGDN